MENLRREIAESVEAMNRAAQKLQEKSASEAELKTKLDEAQTTIQSLRDAAANNTAIDAEELETLANTLDAAQQQLASVTTASAEAQTALQEGATAGDAASTTAASVAPAAPGERPATDAPVGETQTGDTPAAPEGGG